MPYDVGAVNDKSGNLLVLWKVNDDGSVFSTFTQFNVGHISTSSRVLTTSEETFKNEKGDVVQTEYDYDLSVPFTLMQTDKTTIDFFANDVKNTYWGAYYRRDFNNVKQEWYFPICKLAPQFNQAAPGGATSNAQKLTALVNSAAVSLSAALLASLGAYNSATASVPANQKYLIVETS
jgi:hypothetical protein